MDVKGRALVKLFKDNSDEEQSVVVIIHGDFLSSHEAEVIEKHLSRGWRVGESEILDTYFDLTSC